MHIINAFLELTSLTNRRLRGCVNGDYDEVQQSDSAEESRHNLTDNYQEFTHSWAAFWLCLGHGLTYYSIAIIGYSWLFETWPIENSAYFATVVFTTVSLHSAWQ